MEVRARDMGREPSKVVCLMGEDKRHLLQAVMDRTLFLQEVETRLAQSGKERSAFRIVIKPNFMVFLSRKDPSSYTDPQLVEFLIDRLQERGFTNLAVVESRNVLGKWYRNREVATVASAAGYSARNYKLVDLSLEPLAYDFGGTLGKHFVGKTWQEADYRISFAKNKTHPAARYTLALKKHLRRYHRRGQIPRVPQEA